jgi:hypothetical protein
MIHRGEAAWDGMGHKDLFLIKRCQSMTMLLDYGLATAVLK